MRSVGQRACGWEGAGEPKVEEVAGKFQQGYTVQRSDRRPGCSGRAAVLTGKHKVGLSDEFVEQAKQFAHDRDDGDFRGFAGVA